MSEYLRAEAARVRILVSQVRYLQPDFVGDTGKSEYSARPLRTVVRAAHDQVGQLRPHRRTGLP
ncbi:hypothetical protein IU486_29775 [Streptomyces gardneri]|uniref:hypothetical protein n=1 Tax=Nocardia TaxID=1817 RepID=UPI00135715D3|nr:MULTISPECIES: hypothetical protein [Nocardia]MBF6168900.1 hypothetical protein [Streptomyces gardneri]UAK30898.1 hypothetical protein K8O92_23875 [Nocardia asteroides]